MLVAAIITALGCSKRPPSPPSNPTTQMQPAPAVQQETTSPVPTQTTQDQTPQTGIPNYVALSAGPIDESLVEGSSTVTDREIDPQNPPQPGPDEEIVAQEDGRSYLRKTEFHAEVPRIGIANIHLRPVTINGQEWLLGTVTIMNDSRKNTIVDLQICFVQGDVRTVLVGPKAKDPQNRLNSIAMTPRNGVDFAVKTPLKASSGPKSIEAEIVINGPPGLVLDRIPVETVTVDEQGRELPRGPVNFSGGR